MMAFARVLSATLVIMAPGMALAGPAEEANAVIDGVGRQPTAPTTVMRW